MCASFILLVRPVPRHHAPFMTASEAYLEAQRRIRAAKQTGQHWLDLGDIDGLDAVPEEIGELTELRVLVLGRQSYDEKTGAWENNEERWRFIRLIHNLSPLAGLSALQLLNLDSTPVSDLSPLAGLSALQSLNLRHSPVSDLTPLAGLSALQSLDLDYTKVSDLSPLVGLKALKSLDLSATETSDLSPLMGLTALESLDLSITQTSELSPVAGLTALQSLDLSNTQVSDLSPLAGLSFLHTLDLDSTQVGELYSLATLFKLESLNLFCTQVTDLSPLAKLLNLHSLEASGTLVSKLAVLREMEALKELRVTRCLHLGDWKNLTLHPCLEVLHAMEMGRGRVPLEVVTSWPQLRELRTDQMDGVPPEVLSDNWGDNCLPRLRAWQQDLAAGEVKDQEVKVFVLGNGTAGKTQLCRRLRGLGFDPSIPSTHAVQFTELEVMPDAGSGAVKARLWDFGGQDIYHGTHALFLEGRAVFVLVWNPEVEAKGAYEEGGLSLHHHSLTYWLDYVRSLAGADAAIVIAQAQCDRETDRATPPLPVNHGFNRPPATVTCSAKEDEIDELKAALRSATRYLLEVHGSYRLPTSWVAVKERLRELRLTQKTMLRAEFDQLCRDSHGTSVPAALLTYLHRCGEVFYKESLFRDEIVLDQEWAVRAIYAVLDRGGACQQLRHLGGVFPAGLLNTLAWQGAYTAAEQETLLGMMESCSIAFRLSYATDFASRWYAVPDLLPLEKDVQDRVQSLWREDVPVETVTLEYDFFHAGILREFLCQIGQQGGTNAAYWRYGCCFYDARTHSRARVRAHAAATDENPGRGIILIETCEGNCRELLAQLQRAILNIRLGPKPRVIAEAETPAPPIRAVESAKPLDKTLNIQPMPTEKPLVYLSYAWGGEKEKLVDRLEARLILEGYDVRRDKRSMRPGDWITDFMREIERAEKVCVVLSEKYLKSMYCMRELFGLYQRTSGDKAEFLTRIVPLVLEDAPISKTTDRLKHVQHWQAEQKDLNEALKGIEPCNQGDAASELRLISDFCHHTELMLRHASDFLLPRGISDIEKDDFAAVLAALKRQG